MFSKEYTKVWYLVSSLPEAPVSLPSLLITSQLIPQAKSSKVCTSSLDLEELIRIPFQS